MGRWVNNSRGTTQRYLPAYERKSPPNGDGYRLCTVTSGSIAVHRALCEAFHGPPPFPGAKARHLDDDKLNNTPDNVQWGTQSENMLDAVRNGSNQNALKTHCPKGHEYTPDNTGLMVSSRNGRNSRRCLTCHAARERARKTGSKVLINDGVRENPESN